MRKLLEETLMGGEVDECCINLYGRVASCDMFGYAMSSGFGSGRDGGFKPFDFNVPAVADMFSDMGRENSRVTNDCGYTDDRYDLLVTERSLKIFDPNVSAPLTRLDIKPHHDMPTPHLQHLEGEYFGRSRNEAADIFASIFVNNTKIKFPWEK